MGLILKWREMREKMRHCRTTFQRGGGGGLRSGHGETCLEVLYEVIENAKAFRIFAVLDVDQRADLCGLFTTTARQRSTVLYRGTSGILPYLKGDVIVTNADLELLLSNDVLFRPIRIILPFLWQRSGIQPIAFSGLRTL